MTLPLQGALKNWKYIAKISAVFVLLGLVVYGYLYSIEAENPNLLLRSLGYAGAIAISIALLMGPLAKLKPELFSKYLMHRRMVGVWGATFAIAHYLVFSSATNYDSSVITFELNPFTNPLIFGAGALTVYVLMWLTSNDFSVQLLGFKNWKALHRLVYPAYLSNTGHFLLINPPGLNNLAGYALILLAFLVFTTQLLAFIKVTRSKEKKLTIGTLYGVALIALGAWLFYSIFTRLLF